MQKCKAKSGGTFEREGPGAVPQWTRGPAPVDQSSDDESSEDEA